MILKALLAWAGLRAAPQLHDGRVHDALSDAAASISGLRIVARQSMRVSQTLTSDPSDTTRINKGVADMRDTLHELIRRTR